MYRPGGGGPGHHRDADVLEDLRDGWPAAGLAFARPEYFQKFRQVGAAMRRALASVSIASAAAANAALQDKDLVPLRRKINADNR